MGWFSFLILGIIAGVIAKVILRQKVGWLLTIILGVLGAVLGGGLSALLFGTNLLDANGFWSISSWLVAIAGAVIILLIYGFFVRRRKA